MRTILLIISLTAFAAPPAHGCTILSPPAATIAEEVAATGVLIKGRIVQAFDPYRETPEIIEADEIYVGESNPRTYVIYRRNSEFEESRRFREQPRTGNRPAAACGHFFDHKTKVGEVLDRLVLMPAPATSDSAARGRWVFHFWNGSVSRERGLDLLIEAADRQQRLLSRPPKDSLENCRQCAPAIR